VLVNRGDDADSLSDRDSVAFDTSFSEHITSGAHRLFRIPSLRPKQKMVGNKIIFDPTCGGRLIVVERTGGGKSLMLYMTAVSVAGVTLVILPLLSLTTN